MLTFDQLQVAVANAKRQFCRLCEKHPKLRAYLVLSPPGQQTGIDSSPNQILTECPKMIVDDATKSRALEILSRLEKIGWRLEAGHDQARLRNEQDQLNKELDQLLPRLRYDGRTQVELRFTKLDYELIEKLQTDDLVDRELTLQTRASIRVVLGIIERFGTAVRQLT